MKTLRNWGYLALMVTALMMGCPAPTDDGFGGGGGGGGGSPDTIPPVILNTESFVGATKILVKTKINEAGKLYAIAVDKDATPSPTAAQVKAGVDYGTVTVKGTGNLTGVAANVDGYFHVTGLANSTAYDIYIVAEDNAGNLSLVSSELNKTTNAADSTSPSLSGNSSIKTKNSITFTGTLSENALVYALLLADGATAPSVTEVKDGTYTGKVAHQIVYSGTSLSLSFAGLTVNTEYDLYLVSVDVEGNETASATKYDVQTQPLLARIYSVAPVFGTPLPGWADGNEGWIEIEILNAAAFNALSDWAVVFAYYDQARKVYLKKTDISWTLANNDIIRIHGTNYTGTTDVNKSDNNPGIWDYKTTVSDLLNTRYGYVYISNSSTINGSEGVIDLMTYQNAQENQSHWVADGANPNQQNLQFLQNQVPAHWPNSTRSGAVTWNSPADTKLTHYIRLKTTVTQDGESPSDWEQYGPPLLLLSNGSLSPTSVMSGYTGTPTVTISVKAEGKNGATVSSVVANTANLSTSTPSVTLTGPDANSNYTGTVNLDNGKSVGTYPVTINATGTLSTSASTTLNFGVSPGPVIAYAGSDFSGGPAGSGGGSVTAATASANPSPAGGDYLTLNGTPSSNTNIYTSTANLGSATGYTKITFWLKGSAGKGLVVRLGTGSNYYNINDDNIAGPHTIISGPTYAGKTVNVSTWTKVTLNLGSLDPTGMQFIFRGGSNEAYNLEIDHIQYE